MNASNALEKREEWLWWSRGEGREMYTRGPEASDMTSRSIYAYEYALKTGPTFFMNSHFCDLVDYARRSIPDDLEFEAEWMVQPHGWMWLENPAETPHLQIAPENHEYVVDADGLRLPPGTVPKLPISAVSWFPLPELPFHDPRNQYITTSGSRNVEGGWCFQLFLERNRITPGLRGFGMWSYFLLAPGDRVGTRIAQFEEYARTCTEGGYVEQGPETNMLHEIRWIMTAMHLMSEKLATLKRHTPERAVRRRMERQKATVLPEVNVVTLRRMEQPRTDHATRHVDWQWQWPVKHHWRNQYYPSTGEHKWKFIEDFVKGPEDKPMKPATPTVYVARR